MGEFDRSSKWLIQHHGDALLRLGGIRQVTSWRALASEVVQPAQLPDGLIEAQLPGAARPALFLVEVATYPEQRVTEQLRGGMTLVLKDRGVLPEALALVLRPKGQFRVPDGCRLRSDLGWSELQVRWKVVELWKLSADELLATHDPGLMPWVPLTSFAGPPEPVIEQCREVIDGAPLDERLDLLAVTQVLTRLRYNSSSLLALLGGHRVMIESPLLQEIVAEAKAKGMAEGKVVGKAEARTQTSREAILAVLLTRFGAVPAQLRSLLEERVDAERMEELLSLAVRCQDLEEFRAYLLT